MDSTRDCGGRCNYGLEDCCSDYLHWNTTVSKDVKKDAKIKQVNADISDFQAIAVHAEVFKYHSSLRKFLLNPYMSGDFLDSDGTEKKKRKTEISVFGNL